MTKYGWDDFTFEVDLTTGGALTDLSAYLLEADGCDREALTEDATVAASTYIAHLFTGLTETRESKVVFFYDDTASTGPEAMVGPGCIGHIRTIRWSWGGTKKTSVEAIIKQSDRQPRKGLLTKLTVTFLPTGTVTEA